MQVKNVFILILILQLTACSIQQLSQTSPDPTPVDKEDYIADESSVGVEYTALSILNKGETFTPNKIYFVNKKIKVSKLKTTKDSGNLQQQDRYRRADQKYLLGFFRPYLKKNRFSLICSPVKYGLFSQFETKNKSSIKLKEYSFSVFEGRKLIGVIIKNQNHKLSKKCLKYRKTKDLTEKDNESHAKKEQDKGKNSNKDKARKKKGNSILDWFSQRVL